MTDTITDFSYENAELWLSMAGAKYPGLHIYQYRNLRDEAVMEWALGLDTEKSKLYEQYYVFKQLRSS